MSVLTVEKLNVTFHTDDGAKHAVRDVSFILNNEKLAIVGESGSGKSTVGKAILRLNSPSTQVSAERLAFRDQDLLTCSEKAMRSIRGQHISMIMQDPKFSLNPVVSVGDQIAEALRVHRRISRQAAREAALDMLREVSISDPEHVYDQYPHEISGGMGQRVMIAMMVIPEPDIIIADEPTSALDVSVQQDVLDILTRLIEKKNISLIFISHDLNLVKKFCDRVLVMYSGQVVESIRASDLANASHPYTRGLMESLPSLRHRRATLPVMTRDPAWLTQGGAP
ncbi:ABC transporter ATP-binding protein [Halomonas sp. PAMB 3232]|uniref:ABC transporter ATP-binding protein n=1 Tax=Halomonas sp. PAMB 3232 TaxID=3075221 RepID=UPI002898F111|nr:ABC transporter ATP-binding protein [Halomonas sp. PAMB 3232]WNL38191.1 ABC transporter ATP-binding protein [Halomonas sp. PAMB 3232]